MKKGRTFFLLIFILMVIFPSIPVLCSKDNEVIFVDVNELTLGLYNKDKKIFIKKYPIAIGSKDSPSPIGTWQIKSKALMKGPYGGYWLGLNAPWDTFGIHGTNRPNSIGQMASGGCIRMFNHDIKDLFNRVEYDTIVIVYPGPSFRFSNYNRIIKPNCRGTDVYEVQRRLKDLGYYKGTVNGIYEYSLEFPVLKYKKEHNLSSNTEINKDFLDSIGLIKFE